MPTVDRAPVAATDVPFGVAATAQTLWSTFPADLEQAAGAEPLRLLCARIDPLGASSGFPSRFPLGMGIEPVVDGHRLGHRNAPVQSFVSLRDLARKAHPTDQRGGDRRGRFSAAEQGPGVVDLARKEGSKGGGGAMGALLLALLPLAGRRRR